MDISLSHALIGNQKKQEFNRFENELFTHSFKDVLENLIAMRVNAQQRSIRGEAIDLICDIDEQKMQIVLKFSLSKGQYATSLIREIIDVSQ
jgi:tRNA(Glu) U13 pseudouridine synthase TruD